MVVAEEYSDCANLCQVRMMSMFMLLDYPEVMEAAIGLGKFGNGVE